MTDKQKQVHADLRKGCGSLPPLQLVYVQAGDVAELCQAISDQVARIAELEADLAQLQPHHV